MAESVALFSYGTLQLESVQHANFGRLLTGRDDALLGYAVTTITIRDAGVIASSGTETHLALVPSDDPAAAIPGKVFELSTDELAAADMYEGENYRRVEAPLASGACAWVYVKA